MGKEEGKIEGDKVVTWKGDSVGWYERNAVGYSVGNWERDEVGH